MNRTLVLAFTQNPVILKEMRGRMRGNRAFLLLSLYVGIISLIIGIIYLSFRFSGGPVETVEERQIMGKAVFSAVVLLEMLTISFVAPALTAGAVSSEREHQTYDLLRTTLLPARSLVGGKFMSGLSFLLLLLLAAIPLQSMAFLFGGVAIQELLIGNLILVVMSISFCALGMFFSSFLARTLVSTVLAYAISILLLFGLPIVMFFGLVIFGGVIFGGTPPSAAIEILLAMTGWLLVSTNPIASAVATEVLLINQTGMWYQMLSMSNGGQLVMIAPWIPNTIFYLALSVILISQSVRNVKRAER